MPPAALPSTIEETFLLSALAKGFRTDGRTPFEVRDLKLIFGDEFGWVECTLGGTRYVHLFLTVSNINYSYREYEQ